MIVLFSSDINEGLRCIDNYTRTCMDPRQRGHFYRLYSGTSLVIQEICEEGSYQDGKTRDVKKFMNTLTAEKYGQFRFLEVRTI